MQKNEMSETGKESLKKTTGFLLIFLLTTYLLAGFAKKFNADEYQCMVVGAELAAGKKLYVDIWDNHGPLMSHVAGTIVHLSAVESHDIFYIARMFIFLCVGATVFFTIRLARQVGHPLSFFPEMCGIVLLLFSFFSQKAFEVRSDVPFMAIWAASLWLWLHAFHSRDGGRPWKFLWSGIVLGTCFLFSLKTLFLGATTGIVFCIAMILERRSMVRETIYFGAGTAVVPLAMLFWFQETGTLDPFLLSFVLQNADRESESAGLAFLDMMKSIPISTLCILTGILGPLVMKARKQNVPTSVLLLSVSTATLLFQYLFLLPTHHTQSLLPLSISGSIAFAWFILEKGRELAPKMTFLASVNAPRRWIALLFVIVLTCSLQQRWFKFKAAGQLEEARALLQEIEPESPVMDGYGIPLFRPRPMKYKSWINTLRDRAKNGTLDMDISREMDRHDIRYVVWDRRIANLDRKTTSFIRENYVPLSFPGLLASGKIVFRGNDLYAQTDVRIAGVYHWLVDGPGGVLYIDGKPVSNPVFLADGSYRFSWEGNRLVLSTARPDRWGKMESLIAWKKAILQ